MADTSERTLPTIHLNGSSRQRLVEDAQTAYSALNAALETLCAMRPHQRDYYVSPDTWAPASEEHSRRIETVLQVRDEIAHWAVDVQNL